jgi:hypothetical protein
MTNGICPNIRPLLCSNITDYSTCNTSGNFDEEWSVCSEQVVEALSKEWKVLGELERLADDMDEISIVAAEASAKISTIDWVFYVAVVFDVLSSDSWPSE